MNDEVKWEFFRSGQGGYCWRTITRGTVKQKAVGFPTFALCEEHAKQHGYNQEYRTTEANYE